MKRYTLTLSGLLLLAGCADTPTGPSLRGDPPTEASVPRLDDLQGGAFLADGAAGATVIDFEALAAGGSGFTFVASHSEDGFTVSDPANATVYAFGAPQTGSTLYQASTALVNNTPDGVTVLRRDDGGTFEVASIDVAELNPSNPAPVEIPFTGTLADGSTVSATFTTDGVSGFQTLTFSGFTELVSLSWIQMVPYHQFDNITLDPPDDPPPDDPPPDDPPSAGLPSGPVSKADCMNDGWRAFGFRNQGLCVRFVETGKDAR